MQLFIVCNEHWRQFDNITLEYGAIPIIDGRQIEIILEPGVWAKVLILDVLCVDLESSRLIWTTCQSDNCSERMKKQKKKKPYSMCKHAHECFLKSDFINPETELEKLLEISKNIYHSKADPLEWLIRLLHVHILPLVVFKDEEDKERVDQAVAEQLNEMIALDLKFSSLATDRQDIKKGLRVWRREICQKIEQDKIKLQECSEYFLKLFFEGLKKDIQTSHTELEIITDTLVKEKRKINNCREQEFEKNLIQFDLIRKEREEFLVHFSRVLYYKQEIKLFLNEGLFQSNTKMPDRLNDYIKSIREYETHIHEDVMKLNTKKVFAISVREALYRIQQDIIEFGSSDGLDQGANGQSSSVDVLPPGSKLPYEWQTVQIRISEAVNSTEHLAKLNGDFKNEMIALCNTQHNRPKHPKSCIEKRRSMHLQQSFMHGTFETKTQILQENVRETNPSTAYQSVCKVIQDKIANHFSKVTRDLVREPKLHISCRSRVWVCYERCVFPGLLYSHIKDFYNLAYQDDVDKLDENNGKLNPERLGMLDDMWMLNILGLYTPEADRNGLDHTDIGIGDSEKRKKVKKNQRFSGIIDNMVDIPFLKTVSMKNKSEILFHNKLPKVKRSKTFSHRRSGGIFTDIPYAGLSVPTSLAESALDHFQSADVKCPVKNLIAINHKVFHKRFYTAYDYLEEVVSVSVPITKLQWLYKCVRHISETAEKHAKIIRAGNSVLLSGDDLLTALILFLACPDPRYPRLVSRFYPQLRFLEQYIPDFMDKGEFGFAIMQFLGAYYYILESVIGTDIT